MRISRTLLVAALSLAAGLGAARFASGRTTEGSQRVALVVMDHPNLPWASGRLLTALVYANQLKRSGVQVQLIFYSFGVQWLSILEDLPSGEKVEAVRIKAAKEAAGPFRQLVPKAHLLAKFQALKDAGVPLAVCPGSAKGLGISQELANRKTHLAAVRSDEKGEMDIAPYVKEGYQVWVF